jgi:uncharacterized protein DUF3606
VAKTPTAIRAEKNAGHQSSRQVEQQARQDVRRGQMDDLKKKGSQDRSKINMHEDHEVRYWTKEFGVSKERLQKAVDKVGNSAAAVRKELAA